MTEYEDPDVGGYVETRKVSLFICFHRMLRSSKHTLTFSQPKSYYVRLFESASLYSYAQLFRMSVFSDSAVITDILWKTRLKRVQAEESFITSDGSTEKIRATHRRQPSVYIVKSCMRRNNGEDAGHGNDGGTRSASDSRTGMQIPPNLVNDKCFEWITERKNGE